MIVIHGIKELFSNMMLINAVGGWLLAQVLKTIVFAIKYKRLDWGRLLGDGGMPSGHSATVMGIAATAAFQYGLASPIFALAAILAIVVMHDAMGVRLEAGKHAKALNQLMRTSKGETKEEFEEYLGHTPKQVICGALLGLLIAILHH